MRIVETNEALAAFLSELSSAPYLALDTEFLRDQTYYPKLCLIQVAAPGTPGMEGIIDPLAPGLDLAPFYELLRRPDIVKVLAGTLVPTIRLDPAYIGIIVALLGTTISPYLFFWQASQEVEEQISLGRRQLRQRQGASRSELKYAMWDTVAGMVFSEVVAYFIILAAGATLFAAGKTDVASATDAAAALRPLAGDAAALLLAIGLIGAGVLAVPVLTGSAAYGVAEAFGWRSGLDRQFKGAPQFYLVIVAATLVGMAINFLGINPITALVLSAVLNGLVAAPLIILIMLVSNDRAVMGQRTNGRLLNVVGWATAIVMGAAAVGLIVTSILG